MKPYYRDDSVTIYHGDCREILPTLEPVDLVLTDPPYGIGKAEWDWEFPMWWLELVESLAQFIAITPGTWNLMKLPEVIGKHHYKWTLSAHLVNGMTRGGFGFGNWIPCVIYKKPVTKDMPLVVQEWCAKFAAWCDSHSISKKQINDICGTSDMAGWWLGLIPYRCQIPASHQWNKLKVALSLPSELDIPSHYYSNSYIPKGDCKDFVVGLEPKPFHPSPKPLNVIRWFLDSIPGDIALDPFMGSGTTLRAAKDLGRKAIGIEIEEKYCEIAAKRMSQSVMELSV